tara:strand:+ start:724 stop:990 length:267 start_codon:yes stop_codon:yes gene_type:complete
MVVTKEDIQRLNDSTMEELESENKKLKKRVQEAEGEVTIVKGIGMNSPEMKTLQAENEKLKKDLASAKEDHQYDNLVHQNELKSVGKK